MLRATKCLSFPVLHLAYITYITCYLMLPERTQAASTGPAWALASLEREWDPVVSGGQAADGSLYHSRLLTSSQLLQALSSGQLLQGQHSPVEASRLPGSEQFQCEEPSRASFELYSKLYNRTFEDSTEMLMRYNLFAATSRRVILYNRVVQNEILNRTNYAVKPEIGNYFFINPEGPMNAPLWYADITDCELGLIKKYMFAIMFLIDQNNLPGAYRKALDNSDFLPLLSGDGFEQLVYILLVRLQDRFEGDELIRKLHQWPNYLRKLSAYAYNRRQSLRPDFASILSLVSFAYPAFFKDLKYNVWAANRTADNLRANREHEQFAATYGRKYSLKEKNKRLAIFRQRWTLVDELLEENKNSWQNVTVQPDWLRLNELSRYFEDSDSQAYGQSARLRQQQEEQVSLGRQSGYLSQFSELTNAEFIAFITQDFALIDNNKESVSFIDNNFPVRTLDDAYRWELAAELEFRQQPKVAAAASNQDGRERESLKIARRVVDELISDVGLPFGPVSVKISDENELFTWFKKVGDYYKKSYMYPAGISLANQRPDAPELAEENQRRFLQFRSNLGMFRAWFIKSGLRVDSDSKQVAMLRLADMSWHEIKLTLFKLCCLASDPDTQRDLSHDNSTLQYLFSNSDTLCRPFNSERRSSSARSQQEKAQLELDEQAREMTILELYYYYSVHFNKHHLKMDSFYRALSIFKHNIQQLNHFSCSRTPALYRTLKLKVPIEWLSTVDTLDPRRSHTDDLNLDRFRYFSVPNLSVSPGDQQQLITSEELEHHTSLPAILNRGLRPPADVQLVSASGERHQRQDPFFTILTDNTSMNLINRPSAALKQVTSQQQQLNTVTPSQVASTSSNFKDNSQKQPAWDLWNSRYHQNGASRVYELVMARYRNCRNALDKSTSMRRQQCHTSGKLAEIRNDDWFTGGDSDGQCSYYFKGLEHWADGLIKSEPLSSEHLRVIKC